MQLCQDRRGASAAAAAAPAAVGWVGDGGKRIRA